VPLQLDRALRALLGQVGAGPLYRRHPRLVTYVLIGATAAVVDLVTFVVLFNAVGLPALIANTLSVALATIESFTLNSVINFKRTDRVALRFASFVSVSLLGLGVGSAIIHLLNGVLGVDGNLAKVASMPVVVMVQFLLNKHVSFRG
jgi:putative flippase GtrA